MRFLTTFVPVALISAALSAQMPGGPVDALDGLDPVLLVQGKEVPGKSALSAVHGGFTYLFSTAENKTAFERTPDKYAIQLGGLCARMGKATGGNPSDFVVHEGKIYVFGSDECHNRFQAAPARYIPPASKPVPSRADALGRGRKLLDEAARAIGPTLDSVATLVESYTQVQMRSQGELQVATKTMWKYPDRVRQERRATMMGTPMGSTLLFNPEGAWYISLQGQAYPSPAAGRPSLQADFGRHPVALVKNRGRAGVLAAAEGSTSIDGVAVERVRVVDGPIDAIVNLDARRRVHSISFVDRDNEGVYGTFIIFYSDHRAVDGLTLPFGVRALFDGQPDPLQSWTVDAIAVNPALDPSTFAAPAKPSAGH
jgi:YHS domain-containing protein